jgi:hypothetical protein
VTITDLVNDRRIDGATHTFGNEGVLFINAMIWWDWETGSIWRIPGVQQ